MELHILLCSKEISTLPFGSQLSEVSSFLEERYDLKYTDYYLTQNGKRLSDQNDQLQGNIHINLRCLGGKGGFGSMLRAIGAQIEKTTNREACRDLSGRRLRDINEEKRLKAWLDKQKDREAEAEAKRRKKLERLMTVPKHDFKDAQYESARSDLTEKVSEAVEEGFKKAATISAQPTSTNETKRKSPNGGESSNGGIKKKTAASLWIDDELLSSSSETDDSEDDDVEKKKLQNVTVKIQEAVRRIDEETKGEIEAAKENSKHGDVTIAEKQNEEKSVEKTAEEDENALKRNSSEAVEEDEPKTKMMRVEEPEITKEVAAI